MDPISGALVACVFFVALLMAIGSCSKPIDCLRCGQRANEIMRIGDGFHLHCRACDHTEEIS